MAAVKLNTKKKYAPQSSAYKVAALTKVALPLSPRTSNIESKLAATADTSLRANFNNSMAVGSTFSISWSVMATCSQTSEMSGTASGSGAWNTMLRWACLGNCRGRSLFPCALADHGCGTDPWRGPANLRAARSALAPLMLKPPSGCVKSNNKRAAALQCSAPNLRLDSSNNEVAVWFLCTCNSLTCLALPSSAATIIFPTTMKTSCIPLAAKSFTMSSMCWMPDVVAYFFMRLMNVEIFFTMPWICVLKASNALLLSPVYAKHSA
mmetsp:Transcript_100653/g.283853  ORF Transcript_100653/g.283853 Transcript_100653/m.283853 type:complete len:266 (+) Transcript_100653:709-1506(+)